MSGRYRFHAKKRTALNQTLQDSSFTPAPNRSSAIWWTSEFPTMKSWPKLSQMLCGMIFFMTSCVYSCMCSVALFRSCVANISRINPSKICLFEVKQIYCAKNLSYIEGSESRKNRVATKGHILFRSLAFAIGMVRSRAGSRVLRLMGGKLCKMSDKRALLRHVPHLHQFEYPNPCSSNY